ncbi:MAG TPA: UDP-N-acetylglucosamine--N-acetylmuramyl-(pentapeptide) pyrophosphoryl-undecaprenol N-acetylglucosamine transferase, partial [Burkholderiaceae bacterium]|nr:UDP-N-acetylglucosamine--N-acetylmuramyl-(pentapeptide) pyrophosphoryl-undecaprenol N-acetylglucosamine transferase [Burkholderiaceae bacterium]
MSPPKHAVIVAAGTGGHIMPGLAVARELSSRGWTISWIGTATGMENNLVPQAGIELDKLSFAGMRGKGPMHFLSGAAKLIGAMWKALGVIKQRKPAVVFGTGGYVCVPAGLMARVLRRPLVLLNSDAAPLMSVRFLSPFAARIAFGFPGAYPRLGKRALWTGNPVRREVAELPTTQARAAQRRGPLRVMVVGGSLGAMVLNETVPKALARIAPEKRPFVVHQAGQRHVDLVRAAY